jgi:hypothetical protein
MPTFGPGPGQYQSQTTFNPAMQPTVQVEQKQSLFAQIAGLVPAVAGAASDVINLQTKSKIQSYQEREAAAKLEATNNNDLGILEDFYQTEMSTTGALPPAIRTAATEGLVGVKQTISKYNEELQKTAAKEREDYLKRQSETALQLLDVNLEAVKYTYEVDGNFVVAAQNLEQLSKQYEGNLKAQEKIIAAQTRFGVTQKDLIQKQIEQKRTEVLDLRKKANELSSVSSGIISDKFDVDKGTRDFVATNGVNGVIQLIGFNIRDTNLDPRIIWNNETGLPTNDPILKESIEKQGIITAQKFGIKIQDETQQAQIKMRVDNIEKSIKFGAQYFVDSLTNAEEFAKTLSPTDQISFKSKIEQAVNQAITGLSSDISSTSNPQELAEVAYNMNQIFKATPFFTRTAGTSEALNRVQSNGTKALENIALSSVARSFTGAQPSEHAKEWLMNTDGTPSNSTVGDFVLVDQLRSMMNPTDGSPLFSEDELNKILVTGDFSTALTFGQDDAKDMILQAAIDVSKSFRTKDNTDKDGKPKKGVTVDQIMQAQRSGVKIGQLVDKLVLPSQETRNPTIISDGIRGYESLGFSSDRIKQLVNSREPGDQNEQLRLASAMAMRDKQTMNGENPTLNYVEEIAKDLSSSSPFEVMRGIALFRSWNGFENPSIRSYLRNSKESQLTDIQLIQLAHVQNIVDDTGKVSVPNGMTITQYLQNVAMAADPDGSARQTAGATEFKDVLNKLDMININLSKREVDFIKTAYESTKALYPKADATAVTKAMLDKNGFAVVYQPDGSKNLFVDPYGYYVKDDKRQDLLTSVFNKQIPERYKEAYRKHFGVNSNVKFNTFGDLLEIEFAKAGVTAQEMYDLTWNLSFDEDNMLTFFNTAPGNMSPDYQLARGGALQYWDERQSVWKTIYAKDGLTEIRLTNDSLQFPTLSEQPTGGPPFVAMSAQERMAAKPIYDRINRPMRPVVNVGTRSR